jgi:hypothetical protein
VNTTTLTATYNNKNISIIMMKEKYDRQQMEHYIKNSQGAVSACPIMVKEQCIKRYGRMCAQLHFNIRKKMGGKIRKQTLIKACTKISRNKS